MLKKRYTGFDLKVLAILFEVFKQVTEVFQEDFTIRLEDLHGFTVKISKKRYFVDAFTETGFLAGPLASFMVTVEGKISWLRCGGLKIEGSIEKADNKIGLKPSGVWCVRVGDTRRVIDYRFVDPTKQILTSHS